MTKVCNWPCPISKAAPTKSERLILYVESAVHYYLAAAASFAAASPYFTATSFHTFPVAPCGPSWSLVIR